MGSTVCPYPGTCEYDDFKRLGGHYCARGKCPYELQIRKMLLAEIRRLEALEEPTLGDLRWLNRFQREYDDCLLRGGVHAAPDG